ncbi:MAG: hypothetical protein AAF608_11250 [Pseudomonadota bacterium]
MLNLLKTASSLRKSVCQALGGAAASVMLLLPHAQAQELPQVKDIFYDAIETWESYLAFADDLEEVLWNNSRFSETETWEIWLQNAIAAENPSFQALAQRKLESFGVSEERIRAIYRLDPRVLTEKEVITLTFSQRSGVLPVRSNASDLHELRRFYDEREIVDLMLLNSYGATINVLYGTGYVGAPALNPSPVLRDASPDLLPLKQEKQITPAGYEKRQYLESPILSPQLSMPYLGWDWKMFNEHAFDVGTSWEFFMVGMKSSDCKHCQTHAALGMLYKGRTHERIQQMYLFDQGGDFTEREQAMFEFVRSAVHLPSLVTSETIADLEAQFTDEEIDRLVGVAAVTAFLSNYMQISAVVTDKESTDFAEEVLAPLGWRLGRHAGWREEQRAMHPTTLFRLTPGEDAVAKNLVFYRNAFFPVLIGYWGGKIIGPLIMLVIEVGLAALLLMGVAPRKKSAHNDDDVNDGTHTDPSVMTFAAKVS